MTATNTTGRRLTGETLLKRIKDLGTDIPQTDMAFACGYRKEVNGETIPDFKHFLAAILEAKGIPQEHHEAALQVMREQNEREQAEAIQKHISSISILGFRYLEYQYALENGLDDELLAEQQDDFLAQMAAAAVELKTALGLNESGMLLTDVLGVMSHLFAYIQTNRWDPENPPTEEQRRQNFDVVQDWVKDTKMMRRLHAIGDQGFTQEEVDDYNSFRWDHHSQIANYFRTVTLDFSTGSRHQDVPHFSAGLQNVKAYLAMLDENSQWTTTSLMYLLCACIKYEWRADKSPEEITGFASELVKRWVEEGHAIRAEYAKS